MCLPLDSVNSIKYNSTPSNWINKHIFFKRICIISNDRLIKKILRNIVKCISYIRTINSRQFVYFGFHYLVY